MKKKIFEKIKRSCVLLAAVTMIMNATDAMAANYKKSDVESDSTYTYVDNYELVEQSDKCHLILTDTNVNVNGKIKDGLIDVCISGDKVKAKKNVAHSYKLKYVGNTDGRYLLREKATTKQKNIIINLKQVKNDIKNAKEYKIKIRKNKIKTSKDIDISVANKSGRYIYYVISCGKDAKTFYYYQKYDVKKKKLVFSTEIKYKDHVTFDMDKDALYVHSYSDGTVRKYNNRGKITGTYQLPEGEEFMQYENNGKKEILRCWARGVNNNKIYYLNKNGLYRCDTRKGKSFELIYDASKDDLFNIDTNKEFDIADMKVMNNEDFYLIISSKSFTGEISKIVFYTECSETDEF